VVVHKWSYVTKSTTTNKLEWKGFDKGESFKTTPWHKIHNYKDKLDVMKQEISLLTQWSHCVINSHLKSHSTTQIVIQNEIDGTIIYPN